MNATATNTSHRAVRWIRWTFVTDTEYPLSTTSVPVTLTVGTYKLSNLMRALGIDTEHKP